MKSIIYGSVFEKQYYLKERFCWISNRTFSEIGVYDKPNYEVEIGFEERFIEYKQIRETNEFKRELLIGEVIRMDDTEYKILQSTHNVDGTIHYYVDWKEISESENSKTEAEKNLELRTAYIKGRDESNLKSAKYSTSINADTITSNIVCSTSTISADVTKDDKSKIKKWYQF